MCTLFTLFNALSLPIQMWLSYSPVPSLTASYYGVGLSEVDWFSNSYFIASLIVGFFSIFVLDVFGLRTAVSLSLYL